jgi:hypothetical protein
MIHTFASCGNMASLASSQITLFATARCREQTCLDHASFFICPELSQEVESHHLGDAVFEVLWLIL